MASNKELQAQIEALQADLAQARMPKKGGELTIKRSEKGAVSIYGLGRFPVTLYAEQWSRLLGKGADITAFITANKSTLSTKDKPVVGPVVQPFPVETANMDAQGEPVIEQE